jgi:hypothetical protein
MHLGGAQWMTLGGVLFYEDVQCVGHFFTLSYKYRLAIQKTNNAESLHPREILKNEYVENHFDFVGIHNLSFL